MSLEHAISDPRLMCNSESIPQPPALNHVHPSQSCPDSAQNDNIGYFNSGKAALTLNRTIISAILIQGKWGPGGKLNPKTLTLKLSPV